MSIDLPGSFVVAINQNTELIAPESEGAIVGSLFF